MTKTELGAIKDRYDRMCAYVDEDPSGGSTACALAYSIDVPKLIAEVQRLRALQEWRWTYWASSDKVATSGEGYKNRAHALEMANELYPGVPIEIVEFEAIEGEGE